MQPQQPIADAQQPVSWARRVGMFPVHVYRGTLAYVLGGHCRFTPSCSKYALDAIREYGVIRGWWMSVCRICRCHPFCEGGHDPVRPRVLSEPCPKDKNPKGSQKLAGG